MNPIPTKKKIIVLFQDTGCLFQPINGFIGVNITKYSILSNCVNLFAISLALYRTRISFDFVSTKNIHLFFTVSWPWSRGTKRQVGMLFRLNISCFISAIRLSLFRSGLLL